MTVIDHAFVWDGKEFLPVDCDVPRLPQDCRTIGGYVPADAVTPEALSAYARLVSGINRKARVVMSARLKSYERCGGYDPAKMYGVFWPYPENSVWVSMRYDDTAETLAHELFHSVSRFIDTQGLALPSSKLATASAQRHELVGMMIETPIRTGSQTWTTWS